MNLGVVGSRSFTDFQKLCEVIDLYNLQEADAIISGGASGADRMAEDYARTRGLRLSVYLADWQNYGRKAGFLRNEKIVSMSDEVIAFWDGKSRGTKHTIDLAQKAGKLRAVYLFNFPRQQSNEATG